MTEVYVLSAYEPGVPGSGTVYGVFSTEEKARAFAPTVPLPYYGEWRLEKHLLDEPDETDGYPGDKRIPVP